MAKKKVIVKEINIVNRKAKFEYELLTFFEAGIMLTGTEVKSIREGNANLKEAFCYIKDNEVFIRDMYISEYKFGSYANHVPTRTRKLLLKKQEIKKLFRSINEKGNTIIPYKMYDSERGYIKLQIALGRGKKSFDKRQTIKNRENKRDLDRIKKLHGA